MINTCRHKSKWLLKSFREVIQWINILLLILVVLYLMYQYVSITVSPITRLR